MPTIFLLLRIFRLSTRSGPEQVINYLNEVHPGSTKQRINLLKVSHKLTVKLEHHFSYKKLAKGNFFSSFFVPSFAIYRKNS